MLNYSYNTHALGRVIVIVFDHRLLALTQHLKWKITTVLPDYTHAKMAGRKRERYRIGPIISVPFMLELQYESKVIKNY